MSRNYYGNNGELFNVTVTIRNFLEKITLCLWDKAGIPEPLSEEDSLLILRIIDNYVKLQTLTSSDGEFGKYFWSKYGFEQDTPEELELINKVARFFGRSKGLMTEQDWSDKFEKTEDYV